MYVTHRRLKGIEYLDVAKMWCGILFLVISKLMVGSHGQVTDKQYASMPELFYQDNYDTCMMLGDEAFYCSISYVLEPINKENPPEIWTIIKNVSDRYVNYRHDHLRQWICVPWTCPGINKTTENDPMLKQALENCYDKKYKKMGIKGTIHNIRCQTIDPKYPIDWLDIFAGIVFLGYVIFVFYATFYEGIARFKSPEEYARLTTSTAKGKVLAAFSITRNWIRLKTINKTPEIEKLRAIQGIRVYNTALVIMSHSMMTFFVNPIANTRYPETMHQKNAALFFASGPLCVATFFFLSSFLLSNGIFEYMKDKKMNLKTIFVLFANRVFRLTPTVFFIILFHATILRHLGSGPHWDHFIYGECKRCRRNGWSNLLYINNWIDKSNMCLPVTWYLALDTQYFLLSLFFIWFLKAYEKYIWFIVGSAVSFNMIATFLQNYYYDFDALVLPAAEMHFGLETFFRSKPFHYQLGSAIGNTAGPIIGIAFGYYFFKHKNDATPFFNTAFRKRMWWILTFIVMLCFIIIPGHIILQESVPHDTFWASVYVAISRPLMAFSVGVGIIGFSEGMGWLALRVAQWPPTYVLGRLTFSAYIVHMSVVLIRPSLARYPVHVTDFQIIMAFFGDLGVVYLAAAFVTLFVELPMSDIQKLVFVQPKRQGEAEVKKNKDMLKVD